MKKIAFIIGLILIFMFSKNVFAAIYYLDATNGLDTNDGLAQDRAWKNLSKITAATFSAGDNILLKKGETFAGFMQLANETGANGNPIIVGAYGTGTDPIINASGQTRAIDIRNSASYITFQNLDIRNATADSIFLFTGTFTGLRFTDIKITSSTTGFNVNTASTTNTFFQNITVASTTTGFSFAGPSTNDQLNNITLTGGLNAITFTNTATTTGLIINGVTASSTTGSTITFRKLDNANLSNITIANSGGDAIFAQTAVTSSTFSNISITSSTNRGLRLDTLVSGVTISTSSMTGNGTEGISIAGTGLVTLQTVTSSNNIAGSGLSYVGSSGSNLLISNSSFISNGNASNLVNGVSISGSGTATTTNTTASLNANDGFNVSGSGGFRASFLNTTSTSNGINGLSSDGDGYSWHGNNTGVLANSTAKDNKKGGVTNVGTSSVDIYNNIFTHSTQGTLPSVTIIETATARIYNNTFYNPSHQGTALSIENSATSTIRNNLIYGFNIGILENTTGNIVEDHNWAYNVSTTPFSGFTPSITSSSTTDPMFIDVSSNNFGLLSASPAINAGASTGRSTDKLGNPIMGAEDLGPLEYQLISPISSFSSAVSNSTVAFTDTSTDPDGTIALWDWNFGDGQVSTSRNPSNTYSSPGSYNVTLTVTDNHGAQNTSTSTISIAQSNSSGGGGGSLPQPIAPLGGFRIAATSSRDGVVDLSFKYGDDIQYFWISELQNGTHGVGVNSTSTIRWTKPKFGVLYIQFCNGYYQCTNPTTVIPARAINSAYQFKRNLSLLMTGVDVLALQKYLNTNGFILTKNGFGSPGNETNRFGALTRAALIKFQEAHADKILAPYGLKRGTGYFGPSTRAFVESN